METLPQIKETMGTRAARPREEPFSHIRIPEGETPGPHRHRARGRKKKNSEEEKKKLGYDSGKEAKGLRGQLRITPPEANTAETPSVNTKPPDPRKNGTGEV